MMEDFHHGSDDADGVDDGDDVDYRWNQQRTTQAQWTSSPQVSHDDQSSGNHDYSDDDDDASYAVDNEK